MDACPQLITETDESEGEQDSISHSSAYSSQSEALNTQKKKQCQVCSNVITLPLAILSFIIMLLLLFFFRAILSYSFETRITVHFSNREYFYHRRAANS